MTRQSNHLDLRELALRPGAEAERVFDLEIAPVWLGGVAFSVLLRGPGVEVQVRRIAGGHLVRVVLAATVYGPCARCLEDVALDVTAEEEEFVPSRPEEWEESDLSPFIEDLVVDVGGLAREALVLALPTKILCDDSCPGLCPTCGAVAGSPGCGCAPAPADERWAALARLRLPDDAED